MLTGSWALEANEEKGAKAEGSAGLPVPGAEVLSGLTFTAFSNVTTYMSVSASLSKGPLRCRM